MLILLLAIHLTVTCYCNDARGTFSKLDDQKSPVALQAVIGAGAAGLVAARELSCEGHKVTVFEKGSCTGGVWVYTDDVESPDLLGESQPNVCLHHQP